jgi:aromatic-L-amino-acid decarboxylase
MDYGPQLGRRFRALKLWFVLRAYGREGIAARLREHIRLAGKLARWIDEAANWERLAPAPFSTVCFRACPKGLNGGTLDGLNQRILDNVNATGEAFLSHTRLDGKLTLRLAIGNIRSREEHVRRAWELLQAALAEEQEREW